jgi:hypothetical protein
MLRSREDSRGHRSAGPHGDSRKAPENDPHRALDRDDEAHLHAHYQPPYDWQ